MLTQEAPAVLDWVASPTLFAERGRSIEIRVLAGTMAQKPAPDYPNRALPIQHRSVEPDTFDIMVGRSSAESTSVPLQVGTK